MMISHKFIETIGVASSIGSPVEGSEDAPAIIKESSNSCFSAEKQIQLRWHGEIHAEGRSKPIEELKTISSKIAAFTEEQVSKRRRFLVIGGDHSCAIGTWAGVRKSLKDFSFALLWLDAHMDAHTLESSLTKNLHGMPLSVITGNAGESLAHTFPSDRFIDGSDLYLFGIRSFEADEENLLKKSGAHIIKMSFLNTPDKTEDIFLKVVNNIKANYDFFGISLDMDALDPVDAPGVNTPFSGGIGSEQIISLLRKMDAGEKLLGLEICEFNPRRDFGKKTERIILECIDAVFS